jgi:hypothetical protein
MQNEVGSATIFPLTWNWAGGEELTMLISIDVIRYGAGYDAAGHWHEAKADYVSPQEQEEERAIMAPARGAICGLLLSGVIWVGLVAAVRGVLTLIR